MISPFAEACAASDTDDRTVITSDWQETLIQVGATNFELLEFLSDAARAGHRVIITSTMSMHKVGELFELTIELGRMRGYDLIEASRFEMISKADIMALGLEVDYAFDDEVIEQQRFPYTLPGIEIRVHSDFSTSPFTLDGLRDLCALPRKNPVGAATRISLEKV